MLTSASVTTTTAAAAAWIDARTRCVRGGGSCRCRVMTMMSVVMPTTSRVLFQAFLFGATVLEPDLQKKYGLYLVEFERVYLNHSHVESGLQSQLLANMSRRLRARLISEFKRLQTLGGDGRSWTFVSRVHVTFCN